MADQILYEAPNESDAAGTGDAIKSSTDSQMVEMPEWDHQEQELIYQLWFALERGEHEHLKSRLADPDIQKALLMTDAQKAFASTWTPETGNEEDLEARFKTPRFFVELLRTQLRLKNCPYSPKELRAQFLHLTDYEKREERLAIWTLTEEEIKASGALGWRPKRDKLVKLWQQYRDKQADLVKETFDPDKSNFYKEVFGVYPLQMNYIRNIMREKPEDAWWTPEVEEEFHKHFASLCCRLAIKCDDAPRCFKEFREEILGELGVYGEQDQEFVFPKDREERFNKREPDEY